MTDMPWALANVRLWPADAGAYMTMTVALPSLELRALWADRQDDGEIVLHCPADDALGEPAYTFEPWLAEAIKTEVARLWAKADAARSPET